MPINTLFININHEFHIFKDKAKTQKQRVTKWSTTLFGGLEAAQDHVNDDNCKTETRKQKVENV